MNPAPFQTRPRGAFRMHAQQSHPRIRAVWQTPGAPRNICYKYAPREYQATVPLQAAASMHHTPSRRGRELAPGLGPRHARSGTMRGFAPPRFTKVRTGNESRKARFRRFAPQPREPYAHCVGAAQVKNGGISNFPFKINGLHQLRLHTPELLQGMKRHGLALSLSQICPKKMPFQAGRTRAYDSLSTTHYDGLLSALMKLAGDQRPKRASRHWPESEEMRFLPAPLDQTLLHPKVTGARPMLVDGRRHGGTPPEVCFNRPARPSIRVK